jgi:hypothetical protein
VVVPGSHSKSGTSSRHGNSGLSVRCIHLADHGLDTASCNNSRLGVILVFLFLSEQPQVVCSKSQSVSGFGIMKFAPENSLLIDGSRLGSASESPLIRLS